MPENTLSKKIKKLRKVNNLEKKDLAKILDVHLDTIIGWECNRVMPNPYNIKNMCSKFNLELSYFDEYYKPAQEASNSDTQTVKSEFTTQSNNI